MRGISVYLGEGSPKDLEPYIQNIRKLGFNSIFTSLHIPEEDPSVYEERLRELGALALAYEMELMADISPKSLGHLGFTWDNAEGLVEWGVTGLRIDYGVNEETIAELSGKMKIALNASTLTQEGLARLKAAGLRTEAVEAWHNFYPRPETGLDTQDFYEVNEWLKSKGLTVMAFIPGDGKRRGPLFDGLPTLEEHRSISPFAAYMAFEKSGLVDKILVGDITLSEESLMQFAAYDQGVIQLHAESLTENQDLMETAGTVQTNRLDAARDCVRSMESREYGLFGTRRLAPEHTAERPTGSITIDNERYGRYQGEMQITKRALPADERVNVIGRVLPKDLPLIEHIKSGVKFQLIWV
ncbi:DUF871 domain-containing protein [Planomicrobium chinense]|uniref:DUF871 domain-containing protein n=1 Tax=Planococcus chinensis TaxID=272917 RepID=UPI001CC7B6F9|nr:MupG family TIM beta-alpha barrel fold protein [Planococcus chinensis]MBZ5201465.1 DUF871 domain-containing protein [Planococcus chinensis]MCP2035370.1 hypothetical protein [Planomicrobium sp. HSC-17F08]